MRPLELMYEKYKRIIFLMDSYDLNIDKSCRRCNVNPNSWRSLKRRLRKHRLIEV